MLFILGVKGGGGGEDAGVEGVGGGDGAGRVGGAGFDESVAESVGKDERGVEGRAVGAVGAVGVVREG